MSANLIWEPVGRGVDFTPGAVSHCIEQLTSVFGFPCELGKDAIPKLEVLRVLWGGGDDPYGALIEAIWKHRVVRVSAEY